MPLARGHAADHYGRLPGSDKAGARSRLQKGHRADHRVGVGTQRGSDIASDGLEAGKVDEPAAPRDQGERQRAGERSHGDRQPPEADPEHCHDQHGRDERDGLHPANGTSRRTSHPDLERRVPISSVAPINAARSRMPRIPVPAMTSRGNPRP